jgi:hypothetical protein
MSEQQNITTADNAHFPSIRPDWIPVTHWPHPWPTPGAWRALIFAARARQSSKGRIPGNGLIESGVIRRVGRRVLVNPIAFSRWIEDQQK